MENGVGGVWGESDRTAYVTAETTLYHVGQNGKRNPDGPGKAGTLNAVDEYLVLREGDRLIMEMIISLARLPSTTNTGRY